MSKLVRRNQAKQLRVHHHELKEGESKIFQGPNAAPKHVAIVPLSHGISSSKLIRILNHSVQILDAVPDTDHVPVKVGRFNRNLLYMSAGRDLLRLLDACRLADWVLLVLSSEQTIGANEDQLLRSIEGQGISNVIAIVQDFEAHIPASKRSKQVVDLRASLNRYFPTIDKVFNLDSQSDCSNLVRSLCTAATRGIRWRDDRSWMRLANMRWHDPEPLSSVADVTISGIVRGKNLNVDRLVHVPEWGDFQIRQVFEVPRQTTKQQAGNMAIEVNPREWQPSLDQDDLAELAPEVSTSDVMSIASRPGHQGVLLDNDRSFPEVKADAPSSPKRLPKGTSTYQAAWFLDDVSDSDDDTVDEEDDGGDVMMNGASIVGPEDSENLNDVEDMTDAALSEYPEDEMHIDADDEQESRQLEQYRESKRKEAEEDVNFPDEIELHPSVLAKHRLAKYRGLRNLRTSEWNSEEDTPYEPADFARLLQIADYKKSRNAAVREALAGGIGVGTMVEVRLKDVPLDLQHRPLPTSLFSLLRHEHKHMVVNLSLTLASSAEAPLKSKEEVIVQIGPRRFIVNPVFSAAGATPNDVHKFDRYLHPGRSAIASFIGPLTWGSVPVLVFQRSSPPDNIAPPLVEALAADNQMPMSSSLKLVGSATTVPSSRSRVVAKRIVLTGHPYKIHKKLVTIRYMFFNREDVMWFAALPLWTKRGRQGFMKEPLGTHGYFKATFDSKINPMDAVGVSLYKRMWPRPSRPCVV